MKHQFLLAILVFCTFPAFGKVKSVVIDNTIVFTNSNVFQKQSDSGTNRGFPTVYDEIINGYAEINSVDPYLIKCIIKAESDFNPDAVSPAGAVGLMQLMQDTALSYNVFDRYDPDQNIHAGITHFSYLLRSFSGDIPLALAAYHAGYSRVKRCGGIPPIKATIQYVNTVMRFYEKSDSDYTQQVKKLYKKISSDGTILISD